MRSHENSAYAWVDAFNSPQKDSLQMIDKRSLEVVRTLTPIPGKTARHVEFTRDGCYALVSLWDMDGALVVYDARSLEEVKRIPMRSPVGKTRNRISVSSQGKTRTASRRHRLAADLRGALPNGCGEARPPALNP
jgi:hypothetical protein